MRTKKLLEDPISINTHNRSRRMAAISTSLSDK